MHYRIQITGVAPRDGLQNELEILPVASRVALIRRLLAAGVPRVEIGSFVNPKQVPQMAGTAEVAAALLAEPLPPHPWVHASAFHPPAMTVRPAPTKICLPSCTGGSRAALTAFSKGQPYA